MLTNVKETDLGVKEKRMMNKLKKRIEKKISQGKTPMSDTVKEELRERASKNEENGILFVLTVKTTRKE